MNMDEMEVSEAGIAHHGKMLRYLGSTAEAEALLGWLRRMRGGMDLTEYGGREWTSGIREEMYALGEYPIQTIQAETDVRGLLVVVSVHDTRWRLWTRRGDAVRYYECGNLWDLLVTVLVQLTDPLV